MGKIIPILLIPYGSVFNAGYAAGISAQMEKAAEWYRNLVGMTFEVANLVYVFARRPVSQYTGWQAIKEIARDDYIKNDGNGYYVFCQDLAAWGVGGTFGKEQFIPDAPLWPGVAAAGENYLAILAGYTWPGQPWYADEPNEAAGAIVHEIGHLAAQLGHPEPPTDLSVMSSWWKWPNTGLLPNEVEQCLMSPLFTVGGQEPIENQELNHLRDRVATLESRVQVLETHASKGYWQPAPHVY